MTAITVSVLVNAPAERVWDDLSDIASHADWMADARTITFEGGSRSGVGTRFVVDTRLGPLRTRDRMEVLAWDPPRRMTVRHRGAVTGIGVFDLEAAGDGTRFTWTEHLRFPWYFGGVLGAQLARPLLRWIWKRNLAGFQARFSHR